MPASYWDLTGFLHPAGPLCFTPFPTFRHLRNLPFCHFLHKGAHPWAHSGPFSPTVKRVLFLHSEVKRRKSNSEAGGHPGEAPRRVEGHSCSKPFKKEPKTGRKDKKHLFLPPSVSRSLAA